MAELLGGRYRVLSVVGRGGEASVLQAVDTRHDRPVALKVRPVPGDDAIAELQLTEARRLLSLPAHDGLAHARDDFYDDGRHVLVLDWVDGIDLARLLSDEGSPGLPLASVLRWLAQAAEALTALHRHGVVHGDVKPANLILDQQGRVVVVDLGSSSVPGDLGPGAGTPGFRAPELAAGEPPTRACDVYGLAATAFALLTGSAPAGVLPDWERLVPGSGHVLEDAIRAGLSVAPERRPATPGELIERLRAGVGDRVPTGVVTVLLTDVVGSTELWQRIPAQMPGVLARMQLAVDAAVDQHNGVRLGATVEGDSTVSGFARADDAVSAAVAFQRALRRSDPARPTLSVRAGLATGEVVALGGDVIGPTLSRAARVRDLAGAGEVFLSETTSRVVAPALPAGIKLVPLGLHALRGIEGHDDVHAVAADGVATPPDPHRSPYPGLAPFGIDDASYYVGREEVIADALQRLRDDGFVGLVGASGTGKSSLALAGLGPLLTADGPALAVVTPGAHPLAALDAAHAPADGVLVVDQLEEIVTLCRDRDERAAFLERLTDRAGGTVVTLRSDVYGALAGYGSFSSVLAANHLLVGSPSSEDLRRAIVEPAARCGLRSEPGLVDVVLAELGDEPGRLPLLAHALRETWERREGRNLTLAGYRAAGGVEGAIAHTADAIVDAMPDDRRKVARWALLEMVEFRDDGDDTRRWLALGDVDPARRELTAEALDALAAARLVVIEADRATLAHEALLSAWPRLRAWIDEERAGLVARQHVRRAAAAWVDGGRGSADLYRGARLAGALDAVGAAGGAELSPDVGEFLAASRANEELELAGARRMTRRLRALLAGVSVFAVVALVAGVVALSQRQSALDAQATAEQQALTSDAQRLATLAESEPQLAHALRLAVAGVELDDDVETRGALLAVLQQAPDIDRILQVSPTGITSLAASANGDLLVTGDTDGVVRTLETETWEPVGEPVELGEPVPLNAVAVAPDGRFAAVGTTGSGRARLHLVDLAQGTVEVVGSWPSVPPAGVLGPPRSISVAFAPSSARVAVAVAPATPDSGGPVGQRLVLLDAASGRSVWDVEHPLTPGQYEAEVAFLDEETIVTAATQGELLLWDASNGMVQRRFPIGGPFALAPDGRSAVVDATSIGASAHSSPPAVLDLASGEQRELQALPVTAAIERFAYTPDGTEVVGASLGAVRVWDVASGAIVRTFAGQPSGLNLALVDHGTAVATANFDGTVGVWDLDGSHRFARAGQWDIPFEGCPLYPCFAVAPGGDLAATSQADGSFVLADLRTHSPIARLPVRNGSLAPALDFTPDGRHLVTGGVGGVSFWDVDGRQVARTLPMDADVWSLDVSGDGSSLAVETTSAPDRPARLHVVELDTGEARWSTDVTEGHGGAVFSSDGQRLAVPGCCEAPGEVEIRDAQTGERRAAVRADDEVASTAWSPDGSLLATGSASGGLALWRAADGSPVGGPIEAAANRIEQVEFSPDGAIVAASSFDRTVTLWDVATQQQVGASFPTEEFSIPAARFAPNGDLVIVYVTHAASWPTDVGEWMSFACAAAGRGLTRDEWTSLLPDRPYVATCP